MMDLEQEIVHGLWKDNLLNDTSYLIKDGSLEYSRRDSFKGHDLSRLKQHYKYVVGVSKSFNPELFKSDNKSIARTIAEMPEYHRTEAYKYEFEGTTCCVWYLRIRPKNRVSNPLEGIIKIEKMALEDYYDSGIPTDIIDTISLSLLNECSPTCYGRDERWASHLYPVYLTETLIKSTFESDLVFINNFKRDFK